MILIFFHRTVVASVQTGRTLNPLVFLLGLALAVYEEQERQKSLEERKRQAIRKKQTKDAKATLKKASKNLNVKIAQTKRGEAAKMPIRKKIKTIFSSNDQAACHYCGDINPATNIVCSGCGGRLLWANALDEVRKAERQAQRISQTDKKI